MRTIAMINQKGGVGKTTCSINLAACLAHAKQRTLLVDMDPQGHCAVGLAVPDAQVERSIYDILRNPGGTQTIRDITWQIASDFDLAPSNISLVALEQELHGLAGRQDRLADALDRVATHYDYCIMDCPPNVGLLTFNAMRAASEVIIPVETGYFALHGLGKQLELLDQLRKQCKQDIRVRILATLYDVRTKLAREVLAELREQFGELMMEATINFNTKLKEAASFGQPITEYDPISKGFKDFERLAKELMGPAPRMSLDLTSYLGAATHLVAGAGTMQPQLATELTLEDVPEGIELPEPVYRSAGKAVAQLEATIMQAARDVQTHAEDLVRRAGEIKIDSQRSLGVAISEASARRPLEQKLQEFYGVRQLTDGVLFVTRCPNAKTVAIAGDFNNWQPQQAHMVPNGDAATFRALIPLEPGRYRYRLVVDGKWLADPNNVFTEPNGLGDMNSVVEVA